MPKVVNRTGETNIAHNGMKMTIVKYRGREDIDIEFEDGIIVKNKTYSAFKKGSIRHPTVSSQRAWKCLNGETVTCRNGFKATIINYVNSSNFDVQFEDGEIVEQFNNLHNFRKGLVRHSKSATRHPRVGEEALHSSGVKMKITGYNTSHDVEVTFENGLVVHGEYRAFIRGHIGKSEILKAQYNHKVLTAKNGLQISVSDFKNINSLVIRFEDGTIVKNKAYNFNIGNIGHPKYRVCEYVNTFDNEKWFLCTCKKCNGKHMLRLSEMKDFQCKEV